MRNIYDIFEERKLFCEYTDLLECTEMISDYEYIPESFFSDKKDKLIKTIKNIITKFIKWINDLCTNMMTYITSNEKISMMIQGLDIMRYDLEKNNCTIKVKYYPVSLSSITSDFEYEMDSIKKTMKQSFDTNRDQRFIINKRDSDGKERIFREKSFIENAFNEQELQTFFDNKLGIFKLDDESKVEDYVYDVDGISRFLTDSKKAIQLIKKEGQEVKKIYDMMLKQIETTKKDIDNEFVAYMNSGINVSTKVINFYTDVIRKSFRQYLSILNKIFVESRKIKK